MPLLPSNSCQSTERTINKKHNHSGCVIYLWRAQQDCKFPTRCVGLLSPRKIQTASVACFHQLSAPNLCSRPTGTHDKQKPDRGGRFFIYGAPSRTRTCNPQIRNLLLYPIEPWAHIAFILIEFCAFFKSDFIQKNIAVAGGIFECPERKERRKRNGHSKLVKNVWGPKVQRRENVGGSLNPQGPNPTTLSSKSNGLILLTNRNVIHFIWFVKYFCQKFFLLNFCG